MGGVQAPKNAAGAAAQVNNEAAAARLDTLVARLTLAAKKTAKQPPWELNGAVQQGAAVQQCAAVRTCPRENMHQIAAHSWRRAVASSPRMISVSSGPVSIAAPASTH